MTFEKLIEKPKIKNALKEIFDKGYDEGYKDASGKKWHYPSEDDYPKEGKLVFCHGWLTTTYGNNKISELSFIGYYKGCYGWFIKNAIDGESDQSWPVDAWRELDTPPKKLK